jgi:bacterioferritin-associated ferredoxin
MRNFEQESKTIVCRCSDISLKEVRDMIEQGYTEPEEIKRLLRTGMGPCQGRNCGPIILAEVAKMTGRKIEEVKPMNTRPPVKSLKLKKLSVEDHHEE